MRRRAGAQAEIAGQIVLEGFLDLKIPCWQQRLITRLIAIAPAWIGIVLLGDDKIGIMLVISQVVLSMQLPFAIVPLLIFVNSPKIMGKWRVSRPMLALSWGICGLVIAANAFLVYQVIR